MEMSLAMLIALIKKYSTTSSPESEHTHDNKTVIDGITATKVTEWNNKLNSVGHVLTDNNYTSAEKTKLASLSNYTLPKLEHISQLDSAVELSDVKNALNGLISDLISKGYMK